MLRLISLFFIGFLVINKDGQTLGYSQKLSLISQKCTLQKTLSHQIRCHHVVSASRADDEGNVLVEVPKKGIPPWVAPFSTAALGGLLFGSDIGCSSSVVRILGTGASEFGTLSALSLGQIASSSLLGAMISSGMLVLLGDSKIGRKLEFQVASVLFLAGSAIQSFSPTLSLIYIGNLNTNL